MSEKAGGPLPKFGEWDVNDPASAEGFTVIFNKARDEKKTATTAPGSDSPSTKVDPVYKDAPYNTTSKSSSEENTCLVNQNKLCIHQSCEVTQSSFKM